MGWRYKTVDCSSPEVLHLETPLLHVLPPYGHNDLGHLLRRYTYFQLYPVYLWPFIYIIYIFFIIIRCNSVTYTPLTLIHRGLRALHVGDCRCNKLLQSMANNVTNRGVFPLSDNKKRTLVGVLRRGGLIVQVLNSVVRFFRGKLVTGVGNELVSDCVGRHCHIVLVTLRRL